MPSKDDQARLDAFFAEADDIIENWQPGGDAAEWAADGSHQPNHIQGDYYYYDRLSTRRRSQMPGQELRHADYDEAAAFAIDGMAPPVFIYDEMNYIDEMNRRILAHDRPSIHPRYEFYVTADGERYFTITAV